MYVKYCIKHSLESTITWDSHKSSILWPQLHLLFALITEKVVRFTRNVFIKSEYTENGTYVYYMKIMSTSAIFNKFT